MYYVFICLYNIIISCSPPLTRHNISLWLLVCGVEVYIVVFSGCCVGPVRADSGKAGQPLFAVCIRYTGFPRDLCQVTKYYCYATEMPLARIHSQTRFVGPLGSFIAEAGKIWRKKTHTHTNSQYIRVTISGPNPTHYTLLRIPRIYPPKRNGNWILTPKQKYFVSQIFFFFFKLIALKNGRKVPLIPGTYNVTGERTHESLAPRCVFWDTEAAGFVFLILIPPSLQVTPPVGFGSSHLPAMKDVPEDEVRTCCCYSPGIPGTRRVFDPCVKDIFKTVYALRFCFQDVIVIGHCQISTPVRDCVTE